jgi:hypothetical protein
MNAEFEKNTASFRKPTMVAHLPAKGTNYSGDVKTTDAKESAPTSASATADMSKATAGSSSNMSSAQNW